MRARTAAARRPRRHGRRQRPPRQRVARRIPEQEQRDVRRAVRERLQAGPEAEDVAEPVDGRAERAEHVAWHEERLQDVDRVERLCKMTPTSRMHTQRITLFDRPERGDETKRYRDRPGKREPERRRVPVGEQLDRDDARCWREHRILERAETEYADAHLLIGEPCLLERVHIDCEATARDERPESGRHRCDHVTRAERAVLFDTSDLPVGKDVTDVGERLRAESAEKPHGINRLQPCSYMVETCDPRDREERPQRDHRGCNNEREQLGPGPLHMALTHEERHHHPSGTRARMH